MIFLYSVVCSLRLHPREKLLRKGWLADGAQGDLGRVGEHHAVVQQRDGRGNPSTQQIPDRWRNLPPSINEGASTWARRNSSSPPKETYKWTRGSSAMPKWQGAERGRGKHTHAHTQLANSIDPSRRHQHPGGNDVAMPERHHGWCRNRINVTVLE